MTDPRDRLLSALAAVVRDELMEGNYVRLPDIGTFSVRHLPSSLASGDDGEDVMLPPRDVVHFEPWLDEPG